MQKQPGNTARELKQVHVDCDLVIVGGGMAGCCCAITAARAGLKVSLVQDRPVLGGNASSEIRLWILGATSHMGNNNRWAREGGVIDEIMVENMYRNSEGNAVIFDTVVMDKVRSEPNIQLFLNTAVFEAHKSSESHIDSVRAFCSQNSTLYVFAAPLFCDASGDGILGFLAGAAFRIGAESRMEFGERLAPPEESSHLLGHSIYFYTRDSGKPVAFVPPSYALSDITRIPHYRRFNTRDHGCQLWWIEYGGRLDTVHQTEQIKWELWQVVYGVWNHIKNSGEFPDAETLTLEWVGMIPGKRESRRFEGDYMLTQQDIVEQRSHYDAVSMGGWAIDLHPVDGVYSELPSCTQWHSKGVYQVPYRCLYSRNLDNLFLAGRIISVSHIAFGSTRVMASCAHHAQVVGVAASLCLQHDWLPSELCGPGKIEQLQQRLLRSGQCIPGVDAADEDDLARQAKVTASSHFRLDSLPATGDYVSLDSPRAMLLPVEAGQMPTVSFDVRGRRRTELKIELRATSRPGNFTPDVVLEKQTIVIDHHRGASSEKGRSVESGSTREARCAVPSSTATETATRTGTTVEQHVQVEFRANIPQPQYVFVCLMRNRDVSVALTNRRLTGVLSLEHNKNGRVAKAATQSPPDGAGIDEFEFWLPQRRPRGNNLALEISPPLDVFRPDNVVKGVARPTTRPNAWIAAPDDPAPALTLKWNGLKKIRRIELSFDTDFDHAMETVLMGHPERVMPFCVRSYRIRGFEGELISSSVDNYQTRNTVVFEDEVTTDRLSIELDPPSADVPASLLEVRCYAE